MGMLQMWRLWRMARAAGVLRDERGLETLEWLGVGAMVVTVAIAVYLGILQPELEGLAGAIGSTLIGLCCGGGAGTGS